MAAALSHLGHDASTDIVGWLWAVICIGIHRVLYQVIGNTLPTRWQWASLLALEPLARQPPQQIGHYVALSRQQHHWGTMHGSGGGKIGGIGSGDEFSYTMGLRALIDHDGRRCSMATMGPCSPPKHTSISKNTLQQVYVVKARFFNY
jgi:hypothetical protein